MTERTEAEIIVMSRLELGSIHATEMNAALRLKNLTEMTERVRTLRRLHLAEVRTWTNSRGAQ